MITDTQKDLLLEQYIDRGFLKKEIRSYEVSLWTLQDDFMTVLKWSDAEQKGRIENPKMTLNVDGTQKLSFSIPMYYRVNGELVENPNWYNTQNGYLMVGLRKIKVIFNKDDITFGTLDTEENASSHVFEFVITNITESHENDILTCNIECEGLAFQELGKVGYKVNLSQDNFELIYKDWSTKGYWFDKNNRKYSYLQQKIVDDNPATNGIPGAGPGILYIHKTAGNQYEGYLYRDNNIEHVCSVRATKPIQSLDYWCEEAGIERWTGTNINPRTWYYDLVMDWKSFSDSGNRVYYKLYEEPYVSSWDADLKPLSEESYQEKARAVKVEKSNLYNITQTIAETFEVFCRYKYYYDENYHIIGRRIIFYNNFIQDDTDKMLTLQYPYSSSKIERKMESESVTTKLFVLDTDNSSTMSGYSSIMNAPPNDSREDYILNFDYMLRTNAITQEQYEAIQPYKKKMRTLNDDLEVLQQTLSSYQIEKPKIEAKKTTAKNSIDLDAEQVLQNHELLNAIDVKDGRADGLISRDGAHADQYFVKQDSDTISLITKDKGIIADSLRAYTEFQATSQGPMLSNEVDIIPVIDRENNITGIQLKDRSQLTRSSVIDWTKVFEEVKYDDENHYGFKPAEYNGNVVLFNRMIVPASRMAAAGYTDFDGLDDSEAYATLYSQAETSYKFIDNGNTQTITKDGKEITLPIYDAAVDDNDNPISATGEDKFYDIVFTPIKADGTVLHEAECRQYLALILQSGTTVEQWMSADAAKDKLILGCFELSDLEDHSVQQSFTDELHAGQAAWDTVRSHYNWLGYNSNIDNVEFSDSIPSTLQTKINSKTKTVPEAEKIYLTYLYDPKLYYQKIIDTWTAKQYDDAAEYKDRVRELGPTSLDDDEFDLEAVYNYYAKNRLAHENYSDALQNEIEIVRQLAYDNGLNKKINDATADIEEKIQEKNEVITAFEHMMGPALREGYWQPEDYNDYGDHHNYISTDDFTFDEDITLDAKDGLLIGWDTELFDDEDKLYYEIGVERNKEYYPCIDLLQLFGQEANIPSDLDKYTLVWWANNNVNTPAADSDDWKSAKDLQMLSVGSQILIKHIKISDQIKPMLVVIGAKTFSGDQLDRMIRTGGARLEKYSVEAEQSDMADINTRKMVVKHDNKISVGNAWKCYKRNDLVTKPSDWSQDLWNMYIGDADVHIVYRRIKFSSMSLKTDTDNLKIHYNGNLLKIGENYRVNTRNTLRSNDSQYYPEYYVTIKPEVFIKNKGMYKSWKIDYVFSNANTAIYLDALKVSKENAVPKVSYTIDINLLDQSLMRELYNKLAQIVMVNDTDLKFENVFGYISGLELDLDRPWQDTVEIKNYKTKFEDLFSSIVAQTEAMKQSSANLSTAVSGDIPLSEEGLTSTLQSPAVQNIFNSYIDSHFDSSTVVIDRLTSLFNDASKILSGANRTLGQTMATTLVNQSILNQFAEDVGASLSVQAFRQAERPQKFKFGDVWIRLSKTDSNKVIGQYMAITSSDQLNGQVDIPGNETRGFVRTYDASLASITGAALNIDAVAGTIDIEAQNYLNIKSGNNIYIAANDTVDIVGRREVNISGTDINISAGYSREMVDGMIIENENSTLVNPGSIKLTTGLMPKDTSNMGTQSHIFINPDKIEMGAAELELKAASGITLLTSTGFSSQTSVISLTAEDGLWLGAGAGVRLYSGESVQENNNNENEEEQVLPDVQVYVGPKHNVTFHEGDYWIQTTTAQRVKNNKTIIYDFYDGYKGKSYYIGYIMGPDDEFQTDANFIIQHIYKATADWQNVNDITDSNTNGWSLTNKYTVDKSGAYNLLTEHGPRGASIELNPEHLLFGYSNVKNNGSTALELTEDYLIIAAGNYLVNRDGNELLINGYDRDTVIDDTGLTDQEVMQLLHKKRNSLVGAKFTHDSIGFATSANGEVNAILMDDQGITIGSGSVDVTLPTGTGETGETGTLRASKGSYVRISGDEGIELGSLADLYINTDNFKLQTHSRDKNNNNSEFEDGETIMAVGSNLQAIGYNTEYDPTLFNNAGGFKNGSTVIGTANDKPNVRLLVNKNGAYIKGTVYADAGSFTGAVTATSFILQNPNDYSITITYALSTNGTSYSGLSWGTKPTTSEITTYRNDHSNAEIYLWTKTVTSIGGQSSDPTYTCQFIDSTGNISTTIIDYTVSASNSTPNSSTWTDYTTAKNSLSASTPFLITRTRIFINGTWNTSYSYSKMVDDNQPYVISIKTLYWLKVNTDPTNLSTTSGATEVTNTTNGTDQWTLTVPNYTGTATNTYTYYTCEQKKWVNHDPLLEWTAPVQDYGLTVANQHATKALKDAQDAATAADPITAYGLFGYDLSKTNTAAGNGIPAYSANHYPKWNNKEYALILGNSMTKPMLIGSNGGVTIADTNLSAGQTGYGAAVVLSGGGIGMHGTSINFTTTSNTTTNAVSIDNTGITMGTSGNITLLSNNVILDSTATTTNSIFELKNGNTTYLKYSITNGLEVTGAIQATSGIIGNNTTSYPFYEEVQPMPNGTNQKHIYYTWTDDDDTWYHGWHIEGGILKSEHLFRDRKEITPGVFQTTIPDEQGHGVDTVIYSQARIYSNPRIAGDLDPNAWSMGTYTCRTFDRTTITDPSTNQPYPPYYYPNNNDSSGTPCKYTNSRKQDANGYDIEEDIMNYSFFTHGGCLVSNHASLRRLYYDKVSQGEKEIDMDTLLDVIENWEFVKAQTGIVSQNTTIEPSSSSTSNESYTYTKGQTGIMGHWSGEKTINTTIQFNPQLASSSCNIVCKLTWTKSSTSINSSLTSATSYDIRFKDNQDVWRKLTLGNNITVANITNGKNITIPFSYTLANLQTIAIIGIKITGNFTQDGSSTDDDVLTLEIVSINH